MSSAVPNSEWQEGNRNQKSENLRRLIQGAAVIVSRIPQSVLIRMHILVRHADNETPVCVVPVKDDVTALFDSPQAARSLIEAFAEMQRGWL